jgi:hypothetical protein
MKNVNILILIFTFSLANCSPETNNSSLLVENNISDRKIENPIKIDPSDIDFSLEDKFIDLHLWNKNRNLSASEFYHSYSSEFKKWDISLDISNDRATAVDGTIYPRYAWKNRLERSLTQHTNDHFKSRVISQAYHRHIYPILKNNPEINQSFKSFLYLYHVYFGSDIAPVKKKLSLYAKLNPFFTDRRYSVALSKFMNEISSAFPKRSPDTTGPLKIAIITGPYGSGHTSSAKALKEALKGKQNFHVTTLDECTDFPDTLFRMTRKVDPTTGTETGYHACRIYNDITISEGNFRKATLLYILNSKLSDFIPLNKFHYLYERLKNENTDLILSTVHHIEEITANSYMLDIPTRITVTDYEFPSKQWFHLNQIDSTLVQYWVPTLNYKGFFRPLVRDYALKRWDTKLSHARINVIYQQIFHQGKSLADIQEQLGVFSYLPFPVSPKIEPPVSKKESMDHRLNPKLAFSNQAERKVITLSAGGTPNAHVMSRATEQVIRIAPKIPYKLQLAVLTSDNQSVIQKITQVFNSHRIPIMDPLLPTSEGSTPITARILPLLSYPDEMASVYKASDAVISKSGGASTAEIIYSNTPFIRGFALWPWTIENFKYLESLGLSYSASTSTSSGSMKENLTHYLQEVSDDDLISQLNHFLKLDDRPSVKVQRFEEDLVVNLIQTSRQNYLRDWKAFQKKAGRLGEMIELLRIGILDEFEGIKNFNLLERIPFHSKNDSEIYHVEGSDDQSQWVLKFVNLNNSSTALSTEHNTFRFLKKIIPDNVPKSYLINNTLILKTFIRGKSLFELLGSGKMTSELSESLFQLFNRLCQNKLYVRDLHGLNLVYSEDTNKWIIIDNNGYIDQDPNPFGSFYYELKDHWMPEIDPNHPKYDPKAYNKRTRNNLRKIQPILLDRLQLGSSIN